MSRRIGRMEEQPLLTPRAFDVMLAQALLWLLVPFAPLVLADVTGLSSDTSPMVWLGLGVSALAAMAWRLRHVGIYLDDESVVVRNVLWTHRLAPPVRRERMRSSWWSIRPLPVAVLRSDASGRRCKAMACSDENWFELRDSLAAGGMAPPGRRAKRRKRRR